MKRFIALTAACMLVLTTPAFATSTVNPAGEVGPNDFRISFTGPDGVDTYQAREPAVAYDSANNRYLVVWSGVTTTPGEQEIFGQLLNIDGTAFGNAFQISDIGPASNPFYDAYGPAIAYNPDAADFLVVWEGDRDSVDNEFEIFGQRIDASTGAEIGADDFRISDMGSDGLTQYAAEEPDVVYNPDAGEYLVVWSGDDEDITLIDGRFEIYYQRLDGATGAEIGTDTRVSDMGPDVSSAFGAHQPAVAYSTHEKEYLVVWHGDDNVGDLVNDELEVFGQRINAISGAPVGENDFRISHMGPDKDPDFAGIAADVAYDPSFEVYLVVWQGDTNAGALVDDDYEIYAKRLPAKAGVLLRGGQVRISDMGPDGDPLYRVYDPSVAYNGADGEFIVTWTGTDDTGSLTFNDTEIFAQRIVGLAQVGANDMRLSDMGPDGHEDYQGWNSGVVYSPDAHEYLVVWQGDDNIGGLIDDDIEIFGQRFDPAVADAPTVGLVDVTQGRWHLRSGGGVVTSFFYGNPGDIPIAGDWTGNGIATPGLYRQSDGFFYSRNSNTQGPADDECFAGDPSDIPVVGDWDGDGDDNLGIYRPSEQKFYLFTTSCTGSPMGAAQIEFLFGNPGDNPVAGDWDGDGVDEVGLHRESTGFFYWRNTLDTGVASDEIFFGDPNDRFVAGDWGMVDGVDTPAIFRPSDLTFYFRHTLTQGNADSQFTWAGAGSDWIPVSGYFGLD